MKNRKINRAPRRGAMISVISAALMACTVASLSATAQQQAPTNGQVPSGPITTPTNTVGNTPSSVRSGQSQSSGYSAGGSTVNNNINNTQTGGRAPGQPIGSGSKTAAPYGNK